MTDRCARLAASDGFASWRCVGRWRSAVRACDLVAHRVALDHEPAPAAEAVMPLLAMMAADIPAHEKIIGPLRIGQIFRMERPHDIGFAAARELGFGARTAPRAGDQEHGGII